MSAAQRIVPVLATALLGVGTGVYVFQPLLLQYKEETHGTFRPEDVQILPETAPAAVSAASGKADAETVRAVSQDQRPGQGQQDKLAVVSEAQQTRNNSLAVSQLLKDREIGQRTVETPPQLSSS